MKSIADKFKELFSLNLLAVVGFCSLALILFIKTPFSESLWLDESITAWLTGREFSALVLDASRLQAQSPFGFVLFWAWAQVFGNSAIALRSLSLIASLITLTCLGSLGIWLEKYFHQAHTVGDEYSNQVHPPHQSSERTERSRLLAALLPVIFLLSNENFLRLAWTARPYALGLAAFTASVMMLTRWCSSKRLLDCVASFILLLVAFYLHYLLILGCIIHILIVLRLTKTKLPLTTISLLGVTFTILCVPGLYHIYAWSKYRDVWQFLPSINIASSLLAFLPRQWFVYLPAAAIITWISAFPARPFRQMKCISHILGSILGWCALPTLGLITVSLLLGQSLLGNRYLLSKEPGLALLATALFFCISTKRGQKLFLAIWLLLCCGYEINRQWHIENWRQVASHLTQLPNETPVLLHSGLAELKSSTWIKAVEDFADAEDYLTSPLRCYQVTNRIYPIRPPNPDELRNNDVQHDSNKYGIKEVISRITLESGSNIKQLQLVTTGQSDSELILKRLESLGFTAKLEIDLKQIQLYSLKIP